MVAVDDPKTLGRSRLSFASEAEIDEFVATVGKFERGEITPDEWRAYRLVRGTYSQRQDGDIQMLRVKIPQGLLSADQLMTLLSGRPEEVESVASYMPQDFGLTEADMSAYDTRRKAQRKQIDVGVLAPLDVALEQRLRQLNQVQRQRPLSAAQKREREHLLHELEMAMMRNLHALTEQTR